MLIDLKNISENKLIAEDGHIGHVKDFYFDDQKWVIRYVVIDTGSWLPGRLVLLSPHSFRELEPKDKILHVNLSCKQIEESPSIELHRPLSRQYEADYYSYYGWPPYWVGGAMWGLTGFPILSLPLMGSDAPHHDSDHTQDDDHLRSTEELDRYEIHAVDGNLGLVTSFRMDSKTWEITDMIVETGHWYAEKEIFISVSNVERISYGESAIFVNLTKAEIAKTLEKQIVKARL